VTSPYCTRDDVYTLGLTAQAFIVRARPFDAVDAATASIRLKGHGFSAADLVLFESTSGGSLPTGVSTFTAYNPVIVSSDVFRISGFSSFASGGSGWGIGYDPGRRIDAHILESSAEIDDCLTALASPLIAPFPPVIVGLCARMAARAAVNSLIIENNAYRVAVDRLFQREARDFEMLNAWRAGKPVLPAPQDQTDGIAENGARAAQDRVPQEWSMGVL